MPLLLSTHPFNRFTFSVWEIAEPSEFFEQEMPLSESESLELRSLKDLRRLEWLASRWLLHKTTGAAQRLPLAKNAFSKPFFLDQPDLNCSLSHSHGVVGALLAPEVCGCDIQVMVDKMALIAHKFLGNNELQQLKNWPQELIPEYYHLIWTAKESMYKAYGLKALDFRMHMEVSRLVWDGWSGSATGTISKEGFIQSFILQFGKIELAHPGRLVWAVCRTEFPVVQL